MVNEKYKQVYSDSLNRLSIESDLVESSLTCELVTTCFSLKRQKGIKKKVSSQVFQLFKILFGSKVSGSQLFDKICRCIYGQKNLLCHRNDFEEFKSIYSKLANFENAAKIHAKLTKLFEKDKLKLCEDDDHNFM